jgi:hypothetical protein
VSDVLDRVREACAAVASRARSVRVAPERLEALAAELERAPAPLELDPAHHQLGDPGTTLAYVLTLDAVNFGSGWFPKLRKRPGLSGYFTIATSLKEHFEARGAWSAADLRGLDTDACRRVFGQPAGDACVDELMALFARALRELGEWLGARHGDRFEGPFEQAAGSAARLVTALAEMPLYRDVSRYDGIDGYDGIEVPFFKRAQLTAADLAAALGGEGLGRFHDLDRLTLFADNLVPHVLRCEGVLAVEPALAKRIEAEERIPAGAPEEIELRACAVDAVEHMVAAIRQRGGTATAQQLDFQLWNRGQRPEIKAHPRHRTRTTFY